MTEKERYSILKNEYSYLNKKFVEGRKCFILFRHHQLFNNTSSNTFISNSFLLEAGLYLYYWSGEKLTSTRSAPCYLISFFITPCRTSMLCWMWRPRQWRLWTTPTGTPLWSSSTQTASMAPRTWDRGSPRTPAAASTSSMNSQSNWGRPALTYSLVHTVKRIIQLYLYIRYYLNACAEVGCFLIQPPLTWTQPMMHGMAASKTPSESSRCRLYGLLMGR